MPLIRQRKKNRKVNNDIKKNIENNQNTSENYMSKKEPEIKKFLGDKTKSIIKKKQKLIKTIRNDSKYDKIYSELII
tara:strand:+ start:943 stop:1173 length:231 start_codon:yes stop_codon:yes gene_type:complete